MEKMENGQWTSSGSGPSSRKSQSQSKCKRHKKAKKHNLFACGLLVLVAADMASIIV